MNRNKWMILLTFFIHILMDSVICDIKMNRTFVTTPMGIVQGCYRRSWKNRSYESFMGIPYAYPPIGNLRFEPPVPMARWNKTIEAIFPPSICSQYDVVRDIVVGAEDCLYLNIYVPVLNKTEDFKLPVLFWIHGGAFQFGTSSTHQAKYLMDRDIILVTINYRLGPLGFLSTADEIIPGNMGLKDQSLALRWVSKNIRYFGGDPKRITLAGVSAGGASVHYHYLSPMSTGLFRNGMSFSGCALNTWAFTKTSLSTTRILASVLKCPLDNTKIIIQCLKKKSMKEIIQSSRDVVKRTKSNSIMYPPVLERVQSGFFINNTPRAIVKSGKFNDIPWITGFVRDEGLLKTAKILMLEEKATYLDKNWGIAAGYLLDFHYNVPRSEWARLLNLIRKHYLKNESIVNTNSNIMEKLTQLVGDYLISINAQRVAKRQAAVNKSPVYFYYYTYTSAYSCMSAFTNITRDLGSWICHGDDTNFMFENSGIHPDTTELDRSMLEDVLNFWYSVIATGKPKLSVPWLDIGSSKDFQYMLIAGPRNNTMKINNNLSEIQFWSSIGL